MAEKAFQKAHRPLRHSDSIRLLKLTRCDDRRTTLYGSLFEFRLGTCPPYKALSYAWGDGHRTESLRLNGSLLPITKTLFTCLKCLTSVVSEKLIWIDQVCIDQDNHEDKEFSIPLMGRIFEQAQEVIAWLGESNNGAPAGLNLLSILGETLSDRTDHHQWVAKVNRLLKDTGRSPSPDIVTMLFDLTSKSWQEAASLIRRPWFRRLWVVQEVFHAQYLRIFCGGLEIDGRTLFAAIQMISSIVIYPAAPILPDFHHADQLRMLTENRSERSGLQWAHRLSRWQCRDDRDRLNALSSIFARDVSTSWFMPAYTSSVDRMYSMFAQQYICATDNLDILHYAGDSRIVIERNKTETQVFSIVWQATELASWAPDWRIKTRPEPFGAKLADGTNTTTHLDPRYTFSDDGRILSVRARQIDRVLYASVPLATGVHKKLALNGILQIWYALALQVGQDTREVRERFAATLVAEHKLPASHNGLTGGAGSSHRPSFADFEHWASTVLTTETPNDDQDIEQTSSRGLDEATRYGYEVIKVCMYRSFFVAETGRFGLGPVQTKPGSKIFLVQGLSIPFLLDQTSLSKQNTHVVRGECFVEDIPTEARCEDLNMDIHLM